MLKIPHPTRYSRCGSTLGMRIRQCSLIHLCLLPLFMSLEYLPSLRLKRTHAQILNSVIFMTLYIKNVPNIYWSSTFSHQTPVKHPVRSYWHFIMSQGIQRCPVAIQSRGISIHKDICDVVYFLEIFFTCPFFFL